MKETKIEMDLLFDNLKRYCDSDAYPFHMPGHKRNKEMMEEMYGRKKWMPEEIDITEIDGFDNLHHAEGILMEAQKRASRLYGARQSFYLINGSTCGLLAAVFACTKQNGTLLMARNCHKAVYHAAELRGLKTYYLYPASIRQGQLNGVIEPEDVKKALKEHPQIEAVLITSPTYDGMVSDVKRIAEIVHRYRLPLIVDEAHGAHFGFHPYFPENSLNLGADIVIHSLHKTLPSMTQTAILHMGKNTMVDVKNLRKYLGMFETSSPSYVMMAGMDQCIGYLAKKKESLFEVFAKRLEAFYQGSEHLRHVHVVRFQNQDPSKLVIFAESMNGLELAEILRRRYHLEMEMAAKDYVIALTSICDTAEGFQRLLTALTRIDQDLSEQAYQKEENKQYCVKESSTEDMIGEAFVRAEERRENMAVCRISEAADADKTEMDLKESAGKISGEYLYLYPPGIPLLVPGERISDGLHREILSLRKQGFELQGMQDLSGKRIVVTVQVP